MGIIPDQDREYLINKFHDEMRDTVTIITFTRHCEEKSEPCPECGFCDEVEGLMLELAELSDKIKVEFHDYTPESEYVKDLGIDKLPAMVIESSDKRGVRYFGMPGGFEFSSLVADIVDVSRNSTDISPKSKEKVKALDKDVHIQVFVTPTCPYCPAMVRVAHQMAIENPEHVKADAIEASEFPHLADKYKIDAVPTVVINDKVQFEGALPEEAFAEQVIRAVAT
jgi:glutaredoxin-like protein